MSFESLYRLECIYQMQYHLLKIKGLIKIHCPIANHQICIGMVSINSTIDNTIMIDLSLNLFIFIKKREKI